MDGLTTNPQFSNKWTNHLQQLANNRRLFTSQDDDTYKELDTALTLLQNKSHRIFHAVTHSITARANLQLIITKTVQVIQTAQQDNIKFRFRYVCNKIYTILNTYHPKLFEMPADLVIIKRETPDELKTAVDKLKHLGSQLTQEDFDKCILLYYKYSDNEMFRKAFDQFLDFWATADVKNQDSKYLHIIKTVLENPRLPFNEKIISKNICSIIDSKADSQEEVPLIIWERFFTEDTDKSCLNSDLFLANAFEHMSKAFDTISVLFKENPRAMENLKKMLGNVIEGLFGDGKDGHFHAFNILNAGHFCKKLHAIMPEFFTVHETHLLDDKAVVICEDDEEISISKIRLLALSNDSERIKGLIRGYYKESENFKFGVGKIPMPDISAKTLTRLLDTFYKHGTPATKFNWSLSATISFYILSYMMLNDYLKNVIRQNLIEFVPNQFPKEKPKIDDSLEIFLAIAAKQLSELRNNFTIDECDELISILTLAAQFEDDYFPEKKNVIISSCVNLLMFLMEIPPDANLIKRVCAILKEYNHPLDLDFSQKPVRKGHIKALAGVNLRSLTLKFHQEGHHGLGFNEEQAEKLQKIFPKATLALIR